MVITLNGERKEMASSWMELSTKHYERLVPELSKPVEQRDYFKIFQILTDTDFKGYEPTLENEVTIWNAMKWIVEEQFQFSEALPKVLSFKDQIITIPNKIKALSIGQNIALKQLLERSKFMDESISSAVAIYLQPLIDGTKFNSDRVSEIKKEVESMPVYLIRPIGFFLFKSVYPHGNGRVSFWQRIKNNLTMKQGRILQSWQRSQGSISIPRSH
ncbi:MAG: hypothetical protein RI909_1883 [Bacteroidota bacterium]